MVDESFTEVSRVIWRKELLLAYLADGASGPHKITCANEAEARRLYWALYRRRGETKDKVSIKLRGHELEVAPQVQAAPPIVAMAEPA